VGTRGNADRECLATRGSAALSDALC